MASMEKLLLNSISQTLFTIVLFTVVDNVFFFLLREHTHERVNYLLLAVHDMKRSSILTLLGCLTHYLYASATESTHTRARESAGKAEAQAHSHSERAQAEAQP